MLLFPIQDDFTEKLPYFFKGVGLNYNQEHVIRPGGRLETEWSYGNYQIIQCVRGKGKIILENRTATLQEGAFLFLVPNEPHEYYSITDEWIVNWIIFSGNGIENFVKNILGITHDDIFSLSAPQMLSEKIDLLYKTFLSSNPSKNTVGSTMIYDILMDIYRLSSQKQTDSVIEKTAKLTPVFNYIDEHYNETISLSTLAELVKITPQHLCSSFKILTNHTIFDYIIKYRIQKSKELLIGSNELQIKEVALTCGFNDISYFCSCFKKYEGITPSEYRKRK